MQGRSPSRRALEAAASAPADPHDLVPFIMGVLPLVFSSGAARDAARDGGGVFSECSESPSSAWS